MTDFNISNVTEDGGANNSFREVRIPVPWGFIAGRWYGDQSVRPILSLHGWLDNCGTYARLAPLLESHVSLLCVDLPGHGFSSHLPAGLLYDNLEYARAILRIMHAYNWKKVSLMGHSMGASVIFHFAAFYPDRVDLIIALDLVKILYIEPSVLPSVLKHTTENALVYNERLAPLWSGAVTAEPPSYSYAECERLLYEGSDRSVDLENCKYILERNLSKSQKYPDKYYFSRDGRIKYLNEFNPNASLTNEMVRRICSASIPYLVIKASASTNISARSAEAVNELRALNPLFQLHVVEGGTHHLHLNGPQPVADLILGFLQQHQLLAEIKHQAKASL